MTRPSTTADGSGHMIVRASTDDTEILSHVIAEAFTDLAPCWWLLPDRDTRRAIFPDYFSLYVTDALTGGIVYTTPDRDAAALWIPGTGPAGPSPGYDQELARITGPHAERFRVFDAELAGHHLTGVVHHHLAILAVTPARQGRGIGTAMLRTHHAVLDQAGTTGYLEASDEQTRRIYLKHGYADAGSPIELPDGPRMYPMARPPRPQEPGGPGAGAARLRPAAPAPGQEQR